MFKVYYEKEKVKFSLITSFVLISLLIATAISAFAYAGCTASTLAFQRTYDTDMGCSYVNSPIKLTNKSISTSISAPTNLSLDTYVAAWRNDGSLIDGKSHTGDNGRSSVSFIWYVAEPTRTIHTGIIDEAPGTVGDCKGYHSRIYQ